MSSTSERAFIPRHLAAGAVLLRAVSHLTVITGSWIHSSASKSSIRRFVITEKAPIIIRDGRVGYHSVL